MDRSVDCGLPIIVPLPRSAELVPSFAQEQIWLHHQLFPDSTAFNLQRAVRIKGPLRIPVLERSLAEIVRRHEALRSSFPEVHGRPALAVASSVEMEFSVVDLGLLYGRDEIAPDVDSLMKEEAERPFDPASGPLFRFKLLVLGDEHYIFILTVHHIVSDGWSLGVFFRELGMLYEAFAAGKPSSLSDFSVQYSDFAYAQRQWLQSEAAKDALNFWKREMGGAPSFLKLPADRPRPAVQTFRGAELSLSLDTTLSGDLKNFSRRAGATLYMTLLSALKTLLSRLTGAADIVIGSPFACRTQVELEGLIGLFSNPVLLRTDLSGEPTFRELLDRVRRTDVYAHQDLPFDKVVEELQPQRSLSHSPLFQVMFNMQNFVDHRLRISGLDIEHLPPRHIESKFDWTFYVYNIEEGIRLHLVYNADLFERSRMAEMLEQFQHLLRQIVEAPERPVGSYSLVTPRSARLLPTNTDEREDNTIYKVVVNHEGSTPSALRIGRMP